MAENPEQFCVLGVKVFALTIPELHVRILNNIRQDRKALVLNVNANCLNLAYHLPWLRQLLNRSELVFCDGFGVMLAARMLGHQIPQRITYADWIWQLAEFAEPQGIAFFFVGARPGVAQKAAERLRARFPDLRIVGVHHGYFDRSPDSEENKALVRQINASKPNILIIGLGMPLQERWLVENWPRINANIALTGGAVFDYVSGDLSRAPRWMTNHGLEWLGRLLIEPRRLWKRYLIGNPLFLYRVLKQRLGLLRMD